MATRRGAKKVNPLRKSAKTVKVPKRRAQQVRRAVSARAAARPAPAAVTTSDYEGARQLLSRYCFALDRGKLDELGTLFHRDAVFSVSFENGQRHTGRETIQAWYERFFQQRPGQYRHMRHKIYEPLLTVNGNTATASTYFDADSVEADSTVRVVAGRYDDTLVRENGQWFFKERAITVFYRYSAGPCEEGM
ncbi:MAG: nuclear transport factor 2 family protein [Candidatus Binatia bacterium]|nr:nuclear transport factor 2 family protein [Candidatus Binatia bacterium]